MFGHNRSSFLLTFGSIITVMHYKLISKTYEMGIPVLVGLQSVGKTSCVDVLIAAAGRRSNIFSYNNEGSANWNVA